VQKLNNKIKGNELSAEEWNEVPSEIQNVIEASGQTLSSGDLTQLRKATNLVLSNIAALRAVTSGSGTVTINGYTSDGDGGGGIFYWDSSSTETDNGGTIIKASAITTGRWIRLYSGAIKVAWFGAKGDGATDDTTALTNAHAIAESVEYKENKNYLISDTNQIEIYDGCKYSGNGAKITVGSGATISDSAGDGFGRYNNNVFYRNSTAGVLLDINVHGFKFDVNEDKINAVGGDVVTTRADNTARITVNNCIYDGNATAVSLGSGGTLYTVVGMFCYLRGYDARVNNNIIKDSGHGITLFNGLYAEVIGNRLSYCGVSSDFTSWANVSAINANGSKKIIIRDNYSYVTGGTTIFASKDATANDVDTVEIKNNELIGCGNNAIASGVRSSVTAAATIESINISRNKIRGFACRITGTLHSGVSASIEDNNSSIIKSIKTDNDIDFLAPWESFNTTDGDVDGSYNVNKEKGNDIGNMQGVQLNGFTSGTFNTIESTDTIKNTPRQGILVRDADVLIVDIVIINNGWSKDSSNNAYQVAESVDIGDVLVANIKARIDGQSYLVNQNSSLCSPCKLTDVQDCTLDLECSNSGNQNRGLRLDNSIAGYKLVVINFAFDNPLISSGVVSLVDDSSGANTRNTIVEWRAKTTTAIFTGSFNVPLGCGNIIKQISDTAARTITFRPAAYYQGSKIKISAITATAGNLTIAPDGTEQIDGVAANDTVAFTASKNYFESSGNWFTG